MGRTLAFRIQQHVDAAMATTVDVRVVTPASFALLGNAGNPTISLFLYRVVENAESRNRPATRLPDGRTRRPPIPLELCYLVTAWAARPPGQVDGAADQLAAREEHRLLGLVVQARAEAGTLGSAELYEEEPTNPVFSSHDTVQVILEPLPVEDHYRIWDCAELPYRLSLTYKARVVGIDLAAKAAAPPVTDAALVFGTGAPGATRCRCAGPAGTGARPTAPTGSSTCPTGRSPSSRATLWAGGC